VDARIVAALLKSRVVGVAIFDPHLRCVQVNAEMARLAATTPDRFVGRTLDEIMRHAKADELSTITHVLSTGNAALDRAVDAGELQLRVDYLPLPGEASAPAGVAIVAVDLSAQRRAENALAERLAVTELLSELSTSFIDLGSAQIDEGLERAMRVIGERLGIDGTHIGQLDDDRGFWRMTHQWVREGFRPSIDEFQAMPVGNITWAAEQIFAGQPIVVHALADLPPEAESLAAILRSLGYQSAVGMPLVANRVVTGFVFFTQGAPRRWSAEVLASLRLTSEILANAIDRKHNDSALGERLAFEEALSQIATRFISASVDAIDGAIEEALRVVGETLRYERTAVFLIEDERMSIRYEWCADGVRSFRDSASGLTIREFGWPVSDIAAGKIVNIDRRTLPPDAVHARRVMERDGFNTLSTVPMRIEDQVIGCVNFHSRAGRALDDTMIARIRLVGDIISGALARKRAELARRRAFAELEGLKNQAERERDYLREEAGGTRLIAESAPMRHLLETLDAVAVTGATVLIRGESGVGKELIARAIHTRSPRHDGPLVKVNCASVPKELFESEFFGHVRGAFTGAFKDRAGRFELADGGTLFLDEIGDVPLELQAKLLRVLQESELERVGDDRTRKVDVRIVAATNRNLERDVLAGTFRQDLYYRLSVFPVEVPPLRARPDDVVPMAEHFLKLSAAKLGRGVELAFDDRQRRMLTSYDWPGNVRELQHVIERAVILSPTPPLNLERALQVGAPATAAPLPPSTGAPQAPPSSPSRLAAPAGTAPILSESDRRALERDSIVAALDKAAGRIAGPGGAAELLGVRPSTLRDRMKALGIQRQA
jgi:transcriptional regulator with GAF, ATPase, and Fis domain